MAHPLAPSSAYSNAFPPLQAFSSWTSSITNINNNKGNSSHHHQQQQYHHQQHQYPSLLTGMKHHYPATNNSFTSLAPPKYPQYLKYTHYANLVTEQYQQQRKRTSTYHDPLEDLDLRLPHYWNKHDKSKYLEVGLNGYDLQYVGPNNSNNNNKPAVNEAGIIRTNFPMRPQCGIYYFEIHIVSTGKDGIFSIGFCTLENVLNKLPGFDKDSFGYHGHTGQVYEQSGQGREYGPNYASGDVIGCGINFANQTAFFTKNGILLGDAFTTLSSSHLYYPTVGLSTQNEKISANFGQESFMFDIVQYTKKIVKSPTDDIMYAKKEINQLVMAYLMHQGYTDTARLFEKNVKYVCTDMKPANDSFLDKDTLTRSQIRKAIMSGSIDAAIEQTQQTYPHLLDQHPDLLFHLKTRKFLDILMNDSCPPLDTPTEHVTTSESEEDEGFFSSSALMMHRTRALNSGHDKLQHQTVYEEDESSDQMASVTGQSHAWPLLSPPIHVAASGRRLSWAAVAATPSSFPPTPGLTESLSDETIAAHGVGSGRRRRLSSFTSVSTSSHSRRNSHSSNHSFVFWDDDYCCGDEDNKKSLASVRKALQYGHELQEEYQDKHPKYLDELMELFGLLSYPDPKTSPLAHFLDISKRDSVASELNNAIQAYQNHTEISNLESIFRQYSATSKELALMGHGQVSLIQQDQLLS
ncbi:MAG: hypothetical protein EXX96DRAFT_198396 [Benjaminiella poitrasii]|nr:MAG: hypothetical protein EXX96DRAFT_198396 [Benjaminiella poitrasii]